MELRHNRPLKATRPSGRAVQRRVKGAALPMTKTVEFVLHQPEARLVTVAGSFNEWNPEATPLSRDGVQGWKTTVPLKPGRYEYRFVVDGQWLSDPNARETAPNAFGSTNSVLVVPAD